MNKIDIKKTDKNMFKEKRNKEGKEREETEYVIRAENVDYTYEGSKTKALDHLNLKIRKGKKVAVMGGNGSGKSTFFLCLNGIRRPDFGRILIDGKQIEYTKKGLLDVRRKVGIVFQNPDEQLFSASVYEEISFGILNLGADEETAERAVRQVIEELELSSFQDQPTHALSGGQKKQVAIADILVMHPKVMILDEPAAALDMKHTKKVNEMIGHLSERGITVLIATHDIEYAYGWADEIVLMHEGRVVRHGEAEEICQDLEGLKEAELEMPAVLRVYRKLIKKKILSEEDRLPRTWEDLEARLAESVRTDRSREEM